MSVQLYHGDCLDFVRTLPAESVDFAFVDPPYNVGKDYGSYKTTCRMKNIFCGVVSG